MIIVTAKMIMKMIMKKMIMIIAMTMMISPPGDTPPSLEADRLHKRPHSPLERKTCQDCHQPHIVISVIVVIVVSSIIVIILKGDLLL